MSGVSQPEIVTQKRLIKLFQEELGYAYLGDYKDRDGNSNIEEQALTKWLADRGHSPQQIAMALHKFTTEAGNPQRELYENNKAAYQILRYGIQVKSEAGQNYETIHLIDWEYPENNNFAIAEEVTLKGTYNRRPDLVLYVNGIAIGVIELKNSRVSIGDGMRQLLSNQKPEFHAWFFSTVQFVFAGSDSEGLRYGTVKTPEKYFLKWKEDEQDDDGYKLDKYLGKMCDKGRLIELMRDFVLFDGGIKKVPRVHQYFGVKEAQANVGKGEGGIIWHTQGSGKSIVMVMLAKWILGNRPEGRVAIVTDRTELDKQIKRVFEDAGEKIERSKSCKDLMSQLGQKTPRLMCSLVHKFGRRDIKDVDAYIKDLQGEPSHTEGEVYVFVDECHRTQSGKLHKLMKAMMPNAVFIGFTGTPLLAKDKETSYEVFGDYIHTYKFGEAVEDEVVLDLIYEARDIEQALGSEEQIDAWFEAKTQGLNDWQKDELKKHWGTKQRVLSSKSRMQRVVDDIVFDFAVKPRLSSSRGNAMLVAKSIDEACRYFALFQDTVFKGKCAVITSYDPQAGDVSTEETGENTVTDKQFVFDTYTKLLQGVEPQPGKSKTEVYEDQTRKQFVDEPANMRLLIVVDKLLTGFDAPSCTYLYLDKTMNDHGLFQAICRTNRLDGDDKDFGYIVDYMDLFKKVEKSIAVYSSELAPSNDGVDPEVMLQERLAKGKERLDDSLEKLEHLCEPIQPPAGALEVIKYFCGNTEIPEDLKEREPRRALLYKATASFVRAYANLADDLSVAEYDGAQVERLKARLKHFLDLRQIVRNASGEHLDLKPYEADMRHLIDTYIEAGTAKKISPFDNTSLVELIVKSGIGDAIAEKLGSMGGNEEAIAETIENNVRSKITKGQLTDPAFYERMSKLLDEVIKARKAQAVAYSEYLKKIAELAKNVHEGCDDSTPQAVDTPGRRAVYNQLKKLFADGAMGDMAQSDGPLDVAIKIDEHVKAKRPNAWRGYQPREQRIKELIHEVVQDIDVVESLFAVIKAQGEY
ncbi:MAG: HsdR family type I site-specific deoxyribonuclease [Planctomycetota bacterium]